MAKKCNDCGEEMLSETGHYFTCRGKGAKIGLGEREPVLALPGDERSKDSEGGSLDGDSQGDGQSNEPSAGRGSEPNVVSGSKGGRGKRKYASNAERQRAYRERKR